MTMMVRDWASVDYYAELGVSRDATQEEIGRAFRALAKQLHPDRYGADSPEAERFKLVTAAYEVLSDPKVRSDYDRVEHDSEAATGVRRRPQPMGTVPKVAPAPLIRWTERKAVGAIVLGVVFLACGVAMLFVMIGLHAHEASESNGRTAVSALVAATTDGRNRLLFRDGAGQTVLAEIPKRSNPGVLDPGERLDVLYLRSKPTDVIANESHFGRDFTLWFVTVKFFFSGPIVLVLGIRKRRQFRTARLIPA